MQQIEPTSLASSAVAGNQSGLRVTQSHNPTSTEETAKQPLEIQPARDELVLRSPFSQNPDLAKRVAELEKSLAGEKEQIDGHIIRFRFGDPLNTEVFLGATLVAQEEMASLDPNQKAFLLGLQLFTHTLLKQDNALLPWLEKTESIPDEVHPELLSRLEKVTRELITQEGNQSLLELAQKAESEGLNPPEMALLRGVLAAYTLVNEHQPKPASKPKSIWTTLATWCFFWRRNQPSQSQLPQSSHRLEQITFLTKPEIALLTAIHQAVVQAETRRVREQQEAQERQEKALRDAEARRIKAERDAEAKKLQAEREAEAQRVEADRQADIARRIPPGKQHHGENLEGRNLSNLPLDEYQFTDANLTGANLIGASLVRAALISTTLDGASLTDAHLNGADLASASLKEANLVGADLSPFREEGSSYYSYYDGCTRTKTKLTRTNLQGAHLEGADCSRATFEKSEMANVHLEDSTCQGSHFERADMSAAQLQNAKLKGASFRGANLSGANLAGADLTGADLSNVDLTGADLTGAILINADLRGANLTDTNLTKADMSSAIFNKATQTSKGTVFYTAKLHGAKLARVAFASGLSLEEADLTGADLTEADLTSVSLNNTNLAGVKMRRTETDGPKQFKTALNYHPENSYG